MEEYANIFIIALNQAIKQVFPVYLPTYLYQVKSSEELAYVFYYYPDVSIKIPEYNNIITLAYSYLSDYPVYAIAESLVGAVLLNMQVNDLSRMTEDEVINSFNKLKHTLPNNWDKNINTDTERRYFIARALLGVFTGLKIRERLISDIRLSDIDARYELQKLTNSGIVTFYPFIYEDEALADVILSNYQLIPEYIKQMLYIPGFTKTEQTQLTPVKLTTEKTPNKFTRPSIKYTQKSLERTYQFMNSLDITELKRMGSTIGIKGNDKIELINSILDRIVTMPYGQIPNKLKQIYDLLVDNDTVTDYIKQAESLTTSELRKITHTHTPATRQQLIQTAVEELLEPWYNIITTHPQYVIEQLQIVVPENMNPVKYLQDNLSSYKNVIENRYPIVTIEQLIKMKNPKEYLTHLTDLELFSMFGVQVEYTSRNELITNLFNSLYTPTFLIPLDKSKCINKDVKNPEIAYGTPLGFICMTREQMNKRPIEIDGYVIPNQPTRLI